MKLMKKATSSNEELEISDEESTTESDFISASTSLQSSDQPGRNRYFEGKKTGYFNQFINFGFIYL